MDANSLEIYSSASSELVNCMLAVSRMSARWANARVCVSRMTHFSAFFLLAHMLAVRHTLTGLFGQFYTNCGLEGICLCDGNSVGGRCHQPQSRLCTLKSSA